MRIVVLSFFRNAAGYQVQRFMKQCASLMNAHPTNNVSVVAVYGDCIDRTKESIQAHADRLDVPVLLVEANHGELVYGSTEQPERMRDLSIIANKGLDEVEALTQGECFVWYVESDLIWDAQTVMRLHDKMMKFIDADVLAPLVFAGEYFYDIYSFRGLDGTRFSPVKPYHSSLNINGLTEVSSVGSAFLMCGHLLHDTRIRNAGALPGFFEDARSHQHQIFVDATEKVQHPA